jgi:predicted transcriptional regulator
LKGIKDINKIIIDVINEGYSQHRIAKVLNISQTAVYKIVKKFNRE